MRQEAAVLAALMLASACGQDTAQVRIAQAPVEGAAMSQGARDARAVTSAEQAVAAFQRLWRGGLAASLAEPRRQWLDSLVEAQTPSVERLARAAYARRYSGEPLHGRPEALAGDGECWAVHYDGMLSTGLAACVDAATGEVLLAQETPEG